MSYKAILFKFFQYLTYVITFRIAFTVYESNKVVFFVISKIALVKLVKMFIEDKRITTTYIIPVKFDGASFPVLGDTISYLDVGQTSST
jgi:hypothetical protein